MRIQTIVGAALGGLLLASAAQAQNTSSRIGAPPRLEAGVGIMGAAPTGAFGEQIDRAFGVGAFARYRVDAAGAFALRLDASWLNHGWDSQEVTLRSPFGGTRDVDLRSTNDLMFVELGPELSWPVGVVRPYVGASAGAAYFLTGASAERGERDVSFATTVEQHDVVFAYGGRAGVRIPISGNTRGITVDLGAEYQHSDEAEFLRKGDIVVDDGGTISLHPVRAEADLWIFRLGVSVPILRGQRSAGSSR
ncbi:MAG TPA: outer membrane beta-barrel protein [Longimicrobiales bacterium]|nr:outer membrane beta-barrel protein [Longimicrobiales bacterium]